MTYMYTKIKKLMGLKYLRYNTVTLHRFEIDLNCRAQIVH